MKRSPRSSTKPHSGFPAASEASSPGLLVPAYMVDYLNTCPENELRAFTKAYKCPICGGHPRITTDGAEAKTKRRTGEE